MKKKFILLYFTFLFLFPSAWADKIILKTGKVLHGTITTETKSDISINLGSNMFLNIEKSKIKKIQRSKKSEKYDGPIIRLQDMDKPKEVEEVKDETPVGIKVENIGKGKPVKNHRENKENNITFKEIINNETYRISAKDFPHIMAKISDIDKGKGFLNGRKRVPSTTEFEFSWEGNASTEDGKFYWEFLTIYSTMTIISPYWVVPKNAQIEDAEKWNEFIARVIKHNEKHTEIYSKNLSALGRSLSQLRFADEENLRKKSSQTEEKFRKRNENQQKGHDRRRPVSWE